MGLSMPAFTLSGNFPFLLRSGLSVGVVVGVTNGSSCHRRRGLWCWCADVPGWGPFSDEGSSISGVVTKAKSEECEQRSQRWCWRDGGRGPGEAASPNPRNSRARGNEKETAMVNPDKIA